MFVGVGRWVWVCAWRIQLLYKDSIYHVIFVCPISHSLCGLLNKLDGVMEAPSPLFRHMPQ